MSHDCEYCSWDEDGNPDVCTGPPKEAPDCGTCGDSGALLVFEADGPRTENCPDCNPTPEQAAAQFVESRRAQAEYERAVAAGEIEYEEAPF